MTGKPFWELNPTERALTAHPARTQNAHSEATSSQPCPSLILTCDFSWARSVLSIVTPTMPSRGGISIKTVQVVPEGGLIPTGENYR